MRFPFRSVVVFGLLAGLLFATQAVAQHPFDPPARVARMSYLEGDVSFSPAGEPDWVQAGLNRPLIRGDRLWSDRRGRAELQLGGAAVRLDEYTAVTLLELDDRLGQIELTEGRINLFVRRLHRGQVYEIATPTLALVINEPGSYTIEVAEDGRWTEVQLWRGAADAYGERARFPLLEGDSVRFYDARLRDYEFAALRPTEFDRFSFARDERFVRSPSLRYVSDDVIGYDDLDRYGNWSQVRTYGAVWFPSRVSAGWAPYRHGHWIWQEPWGWTWVDDAPWGFAPFHYGRWVLVRDRWGWVPAPPRTRAVYAPALVAFVGGSNWSVGVSLRSDPIGWFPLGPRDVYVPSYRVSQDYFTRVNYGPTFISNTQIINVYNNFYVRDRSLAQIDYSYRSMASAVTVVPSDVFVRSQPVSRAALRVDPEAFTRAEVRRVAQFAPSQRSIIGPAQTAAVQPRQEILQRQVIARTAPPPEIAPFARRQTELQRRPGLALEQPVTRTAEQRDVTQPRRQVRVIDTEQVRQVDRTAPPSADREALVRERIERERTQERPVGRDEGAGERRRASEQEWRSRVEERDTRGEQPSPRGRDAIPSPADRGPGVVPPGRIEERRPADAAEERGVDAATRGRQQPDEAERGRRQAEEAQERADAERRGREAAQQRQVEQRADDERRGRGAAQERQAEQAERAEQERRGREAAQQRRAEQAERADDERRGREAAQQRQTEAQERADAERRGREAAQQRQVEQRGEEERRGREAAQQRQAEQAERADQERRGREAAQQRQAEQAERADQERRGREAAQQRQAEQAERADQERRGREAAQQRQAEQRAGEERRGREAAQQRQAEQAEQAEQERRGREAAQQRQAEQAQRAEQERRGREAAQQREAEQAQRAEQERRGRQAAQQREAEQAQRAEQERRGREAAQQREAEQAQRAEQERRGREAAQQREAEQAQRAEQERRGREAAQQRQAEQAERAEQEQRGRRAAQQQAEAEARAAAERERGARPPQARGQEERTRAEDEEEEESDPRRRGRGGRDD
jgi:hypothetical protein